MTSKIVLDLRQIRLDQEARTRLDATQAPLSRRREPLRDVAAGLAVIAVLAAVLVGIGWRLWDVGPETSVGLVPCVEMDARCLEEQGLGNDR